jgi:hypothetical protein
MRLWISGPRLFEGLVRPGISLGREDLRHRLPSWHHEYQEALKAWAAKYGQPITDAQAAADPARTTSAYDQKCHVTKISISVTSIICDDKCVGRIGTM